MTTLRQSPLKDIANCKFIARILSVFKIKNTNIYIYIQKTAISDVMGKSPII
jgi:hypothetical protein